MTEEERIAENVMELRNSLAQGDRLRIHANGHFRDVGASIGNKDVELPLTDDQRQEIAELLVDIINRSRSIEIKVEKIFTILGEVK
jgi:hypothetical protein